jgi:Uncharacterized conserved protein
MIRIKPHHFLDIIKLYGKGIEKFVPDKKYNHNFYFVANEIINNHQVQIELTTGGDDICSPCIYIGSDGECIDKITHIEGINSKNEWNKKLDRRIIEYTKAQENSRFSAQEYCELLYSIKERVFDIWKEEPDTAKNNRYDAFCAGVRKYLGIL